MSTPTGKLPHIVDLAAHARQAPAAASEQPAESGNEALPRSAYAPKPPEERAAARLRVLGRDEVDDIPLAYAPKRARPQPGAATSCDESLLAVVAKSLNEGAGVLPRDARGYAKKEDAPPLSPAQETGSSPNCAAPSSNPDNDKRNHASRDSKRRALADLEIERIEDVLRQLKRRELAGTRLPRGPNLPGPGAPPSLGREKMQDRVEGLRSSDSRLPPPPLQPVQNVRVMLVVPVACVGAALACYYFVSAPASQPTPKPQTALLALSSPAITRTPQSTSSRGPRLDREPDWAAKTAGAQTDIGEPKKVAVQTIGPEAPANNPQPANARPEPAQEQPPTPSPKNAVRALQPEEIRLLVQQGEKFASDGDIVTARMLFERAAKAGDAPAALALAASYDPIVLARAGVLGIDTDVEKARLWYQKAENLGSAQALERLNALARR
jgi:hypothetical protein